MNPLRSSGRSVTGGSAQALLRRGLVVGAVALSIMLMVGASLMIRTVLAVGRVGLGFRPDRVLTLRVPLPERKYPDAARRVTVLRGTVAEYRERARRDRGGGQHEHASLRQLGWRVEVPGSTANNQPVIGIKSALTTRKRSGSRSSKAGCSPARRSRRAGRSRSSTRPSSARGLRAPTRSAVWCASRG